MNISKKNVIRTAVVGAIAAVAIGLSAGAANAATPSGTAGAYYLQDPGTGVVMTAGSTIGWTYDVVGSKIPDTQDGTVANDALHAIAAPTGATGAYTFIAPRGQEEVRNSWIAWADNGISNPTANTTLYPAASLYAQTLGQPGSVKANGGDYSLGIAFTTNNGVTIITGYTYFTYIHVTAGSGDWTFDTPDAVVPPQPTSGAFTENLQATTIAAQDGVLNLVAPVSTTAVIGNPALVNQLSTSTGSLGEFSVQDLRVVSHPGWTLTTTVADFVNGSNTISKAQLGVAPKLVTAANSGVTAAAAQVAGSAAYPAAFASATNAAAAGTSVFNADLTFVAPATAPAGTYTSTLTITLASK